jgi:DNA-binding XRE family transcriptional regulator
MADAQGKRQASRRTRPVDMSYVVYTEYGMWQILEHRRVDRQCDAVPREILKRYEKWKDIAAISGPPGLRQIFGFHDEALAGAWKGHRSSRLGVQFRVNCRVLPDASIFQVMSITVHDYRRPQMKEFRPARKRVEVSVGESVRTLRELQGLSQNQLAELSGVSQATLSAIENDRVRLGVERAKVLARALRCHPAVLVFPGWEVPVETAA